MKEYINVKKSKNEIPIVFSLDDDYVMQTIVAIYSLLKNAKSVTFYKIYLLVPEEFMKKSKEKITSLENEFGNFSVTYINMQDMFKNIEMQIEHISYPTYYRLVLANILTCENKCIFLDGDILVQNDLSDLFSYNIDNYYIAGVKAPAFHLEGNRKYCEYIGLSHIDNYINAGVLLMNLEKMREDNLQKEFIYILKKKKYPTQDQDILNIVCENNIKLLPFKYNVQVVSANYPMEILEKIFNRNDIKEAKINPIIIHFSNGEIKPWKSFKYQYSDLWWRYLEKTIYIEQLSSIKEKTRRNEIEESIEKLLEILEKHTAIIIFGYTDFSKEIVNEFIELGLKNLKCFCDNDVNKQSYEYKGLKVLSLHDMLDLYTDPYIINTSQRFRREIENQLIMSGIQKDKIYFYKKKPVWLSRAIKGMDLE